MQQQQQQPIRYTYSNNLCAIELLKLQQFPTIESIPNSWYCTGWNENGPRERERRSPEMQKWSNKTQMKKCVQDIRLNNEDASDANT